MFIWPHRKTSKIPRLIHFLSFQWRGILRRNVGIRIAERCSLMQGGAFVSCYFRAEKSFSFHFPLINEFHIIFISCWPTHREIFFISISPYEFISYLFPHDRCSLMQVIAFMSSYFRAANIEIRKEKSFSKQFGPK